MLNQTELNYILVIENTKWISEIYIISCLDFHVYSRPIYIKQWIYSVFFTFHIFYQL